MPDPPLPKHHSRSSPAAGHFQASSRQSGSQPCRDTSPLYAELHCKTNFSFLIGASHPEELVERSAQLNHGALAITDHNSLAGVVRAHVAAKERKSKLLIGAEITPIDAPPVVLLATDRAAYGRLSNLITCGRRAAPKGECRLTFDDLSDHAAGLLAGVLLNSMHGESD